MIYEYCPVRRRQCCGDFRGRVLAKQPRSYLEDCKITGFRYDDGILACLSQKHIPDNHSGGLLLLKERDISIVDLIKSRYNLDLAF